MSTSPSERNGPARLAIVIPVAISSFFFLSILEYCLPLFFSALREADSGYPEGIWATLMVYKVTPWIVGPVLAGLLARRYGERLVWSAALFGQAIIPVMLIVNPHPLMIRLMAAWFGFTGALIWIAGISLVQMVPPEKKGLSNGCMMAGAGLGSVAAPISGRAILHHNELADFQWLDALAQVLGLQTTFSLGEMASPQVADFDSIFWLLTAISIVSAFLVGLWGQHRGRFDQHDQRDWGQTVKDLGYLATSGKFWAMVLPLCLIGGPIFQAANQYLPFRAEDLGLRQGSQDNGWILLALLKTAMWIPGGAAVGLLAGRRAPGIAAVLMLGSFALSAAAIGFAWAGWQLFFGVAAYEFVRQFMRWSHAGYISEHMRNDLRTTAIGVAITVSGTGAATFGWCSSFIWDPVKESSEALCAAAALGIFGSVGLFVYDRFWPIRDTGRRNGNETRT